jgi:hypothetical protein
MGYVSEYPRVYICGLKSKAIPVTGLWDLQSSDMFRITHCLDNRLRDGGKVVSPTHRTRFTPQKHFSASGTQFC